MDADSVAAASEQYRQLRPQYEAFASALASLIERLCAAAGVDSESVTSRAKTVDSVTLKLRTHEHYQSLDDVTDKAGIRITSRYESAVERICDLLSEQFDVLETVTHGRQSPEAFGYASRHLLIRIGAHRSSLPEYAPYDGLVAEVQVRSILQHAWALISHSLDYKTEVDVPLEVRRRLFRVAALLETGDEIFNAFVAEVSELRSEYRDKAATDWGALALNMDSAEAVWERFPWRKLIDVAEAEGWGAAPEWTYELPLDEVDRGALSMLIEAARDAGFTTWGQLAAVADDSERFRTTLREESSRTVEEAPTAWAVGTYILATILTDATEAARSVAGLSD